MARPEQAMPEVLDLKVETMLAADAEVISRWRYPGQYALYDGPLAPEYMLDPRNGFRAVRRSSGLIGFCSFGIDGRVPGGSYEDDALDVGAGMDPALVGNGYGRAFLGALVEYATRELNAVRLRATIASWNERALRAGRSVGFRPILAFQTDHGREFTIVLRETGDVVGR
jgi:ribosomal-protein-alanine N-acetyltransferase